MPVIRAAVDADVPGIREVGRLAWPETYVFAGDDYIAHGLESWWSAEATRRSIRDTSVLVAVDGNDRAARFYARHGFREIGREPGERPGWPMCVWLERPLARVMERRPTP